MLAACEQGLAGLPFGDKDKTIAYLDRRIEFWRVQNLSAIQSFVHPAQAEYALECFNRRINLLGSYLPPNDARKAARAAADEISKQWNPAALDDFITGNTSAARASIWWGQADAAFSAIAKLEVAISHAIDTPTPERDALFDAARNALAEFELTLDQVQEFQHSLDARRRAFWLKALSWRARGAGLAIDLLQRWDFDHDPEGAFALLVRGISEEPPSAEGDLAGDLAPFIARLKRLREERADIDPGAPRDWLSAGVKRTALEGLYLMNYMDATLEDRIDAWQRDEEATKRLDLELVYDIALAREVPEVDARAAVEAAMQAFRDRQREVREGAVKRLRDALAAERMGYVFQGPLLVGATR
jgi:hypothetical protein